MSKPGGGDGDSLFDQLRGAGVHPVAAALLAVGVLLVLGAFTTFEWFRSGTGFFAGAGGATSFGQVRDRLQALRHQAEQAHLGGRVSFSTSLPYFTWLGWVLLLVSAALCAVAISRVGERWWVRYLGAVVAAAGVGLTFLALNLFVFQGNASNNANAPSYSDFLSQSGLGAWSAAAGFACMVVACLLPRRGL